MGPGRPYGQTLPPLEQVLGLATSLGIRGADEKDIHRTGRDHVPLNPWKAFFGSPDRFVTATSRPRHRRWDNSL